MRFSSNKKDAPFFNFCVHPFSDFVCIHASRNYGYVCILFSVAAFYPVRVNDRLQEMQYRVKLYFLFELHFNDKTAAAASRHSSISIR